MKRFPFRPIIAGILLISTALFLPFLLLRVAFSFIIIGALLRLFNRRRNVSYYQDGIRQHYRNTGGGGSRIINLGSSDRASIHID